MTGRFLRALVHPLRRSLRWQPSPPVPDAALLIGVAAMVSHELIRPPGPNDARPHGARRP